MRHFKFSKFNFQNSEKSQFSSFKQVVMNVCNLVSENFLIFEVCELNFAIPKGDA